MSSVPILNSVSECKDAEALVKSVSKTLKEHGITALEKCLGEGEMGKTFSLPGVPLVIKIIKLNPRSKNNNAQAFEHEAALQAALGEIGVGPRIMQSWLTKTHGFIVMEKLAGMYRKLFFDFGDRGDDAEEVKNLLWLDEHAWDVHDTLDYNKQFYLDRNVDRAIIGAIETMIANGFFHNDLHAGNIGFGMDGQVRLFDYGLTKSLSEMCVQSECFSDEVKNQCLGFSLYQVIDHLPLRVRNAFSAIFDTIYEIRLGKYVFGSNIAHFNSFRLDMSNAVTATSKLTQYIQRQSARAAILAKGNEARYGSPGAAKISPRHDRTTHTAKKGGNKTRHTHARGRVSHSSRGRMAFGHRKGKK
jgi:serine/threonine protein kinase